MISGADMNKLFNFLFIFLCLIGSKSTAEHGSEEWQQSRMYVHIEESQRDQFLNWLEGNGEIEWQGNSISWVYRIIVNSSDRLSILDDVKGKSFTKYAVIYEDTVRRILDTEPNDEYYDHMFGDGYYVWPHKNHEDPVGAGSGGGYDMDSPQGWDISTDGSGVIVLVHDQGFRESHEDLLDNLWQNTAEINGSPGVDDDNNGCIDDFHGCFINLHGDHGTGVGGAVAARGNNSVGSVGAAWTAQLSHYSEAVWCDGAWQCIGGMTEAIDYANAIGAKIFNASYGHYGCTFSPGNVDMACVEAEEAIIDSFNGLFVAAAGNETRDNDQWWSLPASARNDHVVAVGALDQAGDNEFNYGSSSVDVHGFASFDIGCGILPYCSADSSGSDDCYALFGGTSCATPQTAGLLALRWTQCPDDTRIEVKQALIDAAADISSLQGLSVSEGMNNMFNLLNSPCASTAPISLTFKGNPPSDVEEGDLSNKDNDVRVYFETNYPESEISYSCQYMMSGFNACNSVDENGSYWESGALADGGQSLTVRATHDNGQFVDETITWTLDSNPPDTVIISGPPNPSSENSATFEFENTNSGENSTTTFECRLDWNAFNDAPWETCTSPKTYTNLSEGTHNFEVRAIDQAGNVDPTPPWFEWNIDIAPITTIDSGPSDPSTSPDATFTFSSSDEPNVIFECKLDSENWEAGNCTSPRVYIGLDEGQHVFEVRAIEATGEGDVGEPAIWEWTIDFAPSVTINSGPDNPTNQTNAIFEFESDDPMATFTCSLNGSSAINCTSPYTYNSLGEDNYSFVVVAEDESGNTGSDTHNWEIDLTQPVVSVSGPEGKINVSTVSYSFSSNEEDSSYECSKELEPWSACTSPKEYSGLAEESHTFHFRTIDPAGNISESSSKTITIDLTLPVTTIDSGPEGYWASSTVTYEFSADEPSTTECNMDSSGWETCTSPQTYVELSEGAHVFEVRAIDEAGNVGLAELRNITVDTVAPTVDITNGPSDPSNSAEATFEFESNESVSFECKLDDNQWESCTSPKVYSNLPDGSHVFKVQATDQAGNISDDPSWSWNIDQTGPNTTIISGPDNPTNETSATFVFESNDSNATFKCSLDQGNWIPCTSGSLFSGLAEGLHNFLVKAIDEAGNEDSTPAEWNWTIDTDSPETTITNDPPDLTNSQSIVFDFESSEPNSTFECEKTADGHWFSCTSPYEINNLSEGWHIFKVRATDEAGNTDQSPAAHDWTVDLTAPSYDITSKPNDPTTDTSATFEFTTDADIIWCKIDDGAWNDSCTSPDSWNDLSVGTHTWELKVFDLAGNEAGESYSWEIIGLDTDAPETTITNDPPDLTNSQSIVFDFESSEPNSTFECEKTADGHWFSCTSPYEINNLSEGWHIFKVRATDEAGNTDQSPAAHDWTVDTVRPETTINDPKPGNPTTDITATFHFESSEPNSTFECRRDELSWESCTSPETYADLTVGTHTFEVRATDLAGNQDESADSYTWTIETETADVTIISGPQEGEEIHNSSTLFTFNSSNTNANFECQDSNNTDWVSCNGDTLSDGEGSHTISAMEDGSNSFTVRALINGNIGGSETRNFIVDAIYDISIKHENPVPAITLDFEPSGIQQPVFRFSYIKTDGPITGQNQLNEITLRASGTGNDKLDIGLVEIWLDMNSDGIPDSESNLGEEEFNADNGTVTITLDDEQGIDNGVNEIIYLITYDFTGDSSLASMPFDIELIFALAFMSLAVIKKRRIAGVFAILLFVTSCGGGGGDSNPSVSKTYNISIQNYSDIVPNENPSVVQLETTPTVSNYITVIQ